MPKNTFKNLPVERQNEILKVCIEEFENKSILNASVGSITSKLGIARSSFYKYFENLEDCYFYLLYRINFDIHSIFSKSIKESDGDLREVLKNYGINISNVLFSENKIGLLKDFFLNKTYSLESNWLKYKSEHSDSNSCMKKDSFYTDYRDMLDMDMLNADSKEEFNDLMMIFQSVSHELIRQCFLYNWDKDAFLKHFDNCVKILLEGMVK